ncbi:LysR family transcriptional regulator [Paraburkholderia sp. MMS20-SJTN17]|uniref:LysR family transcriptional regulator n=1 Tax=Paraburkholderia translucens TaxID=2886945 RepID=A0ABS8K9I9_9BURK|nr:LysR family transcriptional regulator [Paraburkholderia sp. MMS20-SJTN17]MCC8401415.1 LysR family transcriptional regulator [Paraburkholderia sp. MMS20-SJTN17]
MSIYDNLDLLRAFVAIVDSGSISAAARKRRLSQPTLSRQLQALEAQSGAALLRRDTHRMSLTDAGQQILADAQTLLSLAEECESRLRSDQTALSGQIRVFSTIDFGQTVVSRLISSFIQTNPAVRVELGYSNRPLHMIEEGCDAGILAGTLSDERVVSRPLGEITRCVVGSPSLLKEHKKPRKPAHLAGFPWIALSGSQFGNPRHVTLHSGSESCSLELEPVFLTEGGASIREAVRMGLGLAVLPEWFVEEDLLAQRMVRVLPKWRPKPWSAQIVYPAQRRMPLRVKAFVDFATQYMATVLKPHKAASG